MRDGTANILVDKDIGQRFATYDFRKPCKSAVSKLHRLACLLQHHDRNCWAIGDLVAKLIDSHRLPLRVISKWTKYSQARLSELSLTARAFLPEQRAGHSFQDSLLARQVVRRLVTLDMALVEVRDRIERLRMRNRRDVKAYFVQQLVVQQTEAARAISAASPRVQDDLVNRCHHADYREIIPKLPDGSVKLFVADPPFGYYADGNSVPIRARTSGLRTECDNNSTEQAIEVTLPLFSACLPKLAVGGALVLFQPGLRPDNLLILTEAMKCGWTCEFALNWVKNGKSRTAPGNCSDPYAVSTERILIFCRQGERLQWHEQGLERSDVLQFDSETQGATLAMERGETAYGSIHIFQKPAPLIEFLIQKHTYAGDLVVEPFGCSGSGVIAAAKLDRRWLYIESNQANFEWGSNRVAAAIP